MHHHWRRGRRSVIYRRRRRPRVSGRHGVPPEDIIVENEGESTVQSVVTVGEIMQRMGLHSCIVVSDGYHIYRVKKMLEARGLQVYGSPRPSAPVSRWFYFRQAIGYVLWRIGIPV